MFDTLSGIIFHFRIRLVYFFLYVYGLYTFNIIYTITTMFSTETPIKLENKSEYTYDRDNANK